jgi:Cys-tRNA(Pro) deacylase
MREPDIPITTAIRALRTAKVDFTPHFYTYVDLGGTRHAADSLGVDEHTVIKTLLMESQNDGARKLFLLLMHGDFEVSTKQLARFLQVKTVSPATQGAVEKHTGYVPGGVSPFGTRTTLPVYVEETVLALERIYINGGKRGFLVSIQPSVLTSLLAAVPVRVGIRGRRG